jgi:DNA-binding NarL/FixJ family response regulator
MPTAGGARPCEPSGEPEMTIRVAIIDDHPVVVGGYDAALSSVRGMKVVARGGTLAEARELLGRSDIDVALLDVRLEGGSGLAALSERAPRAGPAVLVISSFKTPQYAAAAARFGAVGFLIKSVPLPALIEAIRAAASGALVFTAQQLTERFVTLSPRERQVLALAMEGLSNKEIGARMHTSRKTVEAHLTDIYVRYGILGGRIELSIRAASEGWLEAQPPPGGADRTRPSRTHVKAE